MGCKFAYRYHFSLTEKLFMIMDEPPSAYTLSPKLENTITALNVAVCDFKDKLLSTPYNEGDELITIPPIVAEMLINAWIRDAYMDLVKLFLEEGWTSGNKDTPFPSNNVIRDDGDGNKKFHLEGNFLFKIPGK